MFKPINLNQAFDVNNSLFPSLVRAGDGVTNTVQIISLQVKLNQSRHPLDSITLDPGIVTAVNTKQAADEELAEQGRHNLEM